MAAIEPGVSTDKQWWDFACAYEDCSVLFISLIAIPLPQIFFGKEVQRRMDGNLRKALKGYPLHRQEQRRQDVTIKACFFQKLPNQYLQVLRQF